MVSTPPSFYCHSMMMPLSPLSLQPSFTRPTSSRRSSLASSLPQSISPSLTQLKTMQLPASSKGSVQDPKALMRTAVSELIADDGQAGRPISESLVSELLADLPIKWERLGDLALVPATSLAHPAGESGVTICGHVHNFR